VQNIFYIPEIFCEIPSTAILYAPRDSTSVSLSMAWGIILLNTNPEGYGNIQVHGKIEGHGIYGEENNQNTLNGHIVSVCRCVCLIERDKSVLD